MSSRPLRLGTRGSKLARWQADWTAAQLRQLGVAVELVIVTTTGDARPTDDIHQMGGVGVFTKEIQNALLDGTIDLAVHSLKDVPTTPVPGLQLAAVPKRQATADALVARHVRSIGDLPPKATVGTSSLRRRSQLLRLRPDLQVVDLRGNVDTRLAKLDAGQYDAMVLAAAGLIRLGLEERISQRIPTEQMLPAPAQGALGLECRADDRRAVEALAALDDPDARAAVVAERAMLSRVEGGCLAAIGGLAEVAGDRLTLAAVILSADGSERLTADATGDRQAAEEVGLRVGDALLDQGAQRLVEQRR